MSDRQTRYGLWLGMCLSRDLGLVCLLGGAAQLGCCCPVLTGTAVAIGVVWLTGYVNIYHGNNENVVCEEREVQTFFFSQRRNMEHVHDPSPEVDALFAQIDEARLIEEVSSRHYPRYCHFAHSTHMRPLSTFQHCCLQGRTSSLRLSGTSLPANLVAHSLCLHVPLSVVLSRGHGR